MAALSKEDTDRLFMIYLNFGPHLKEILGKKQIKPTVLASRMGIAPSNVYTYTSMGYHPDMFNLIKMAEALEISVDELVGLKELES